MSIETAQANLKAAKNAVDMAVAERADALSRDDRLAVATAESKIDIANEKLRDAREAFIGAGLAE